ncbi:putative membrane protein YddG [Bienertia sinuspersici]
MLLHRNAILLDHCTNCCNPAVFSILTKFLPRILNEGLTSLGKAGSHMLIDTINQMMTTMVYVNCRSMVSIYLVL